VVAGDLTRPETLAPAVSGASHIIFTAGCRSMHPATGATIRATEYEGTLHTLAAAKAAGLRGRFLYMTASGVGTPSLLATGLNLIKGTPWSGGS
jgi:nucleoside-diphosphate-sugar epimerase